MVPAWRQSAAPISARSKAEGGDDYIPVTLNSSNNGWHKGWFYLRNDSEFVLPSYTGNSITKS
jgi:hypothetical protein